MNALPNVSIFTEPDVESLPVKPARTERSFNVHDLPTLSAVSIQSRIGQLVRRETDAAAFATNDVVSPNATASANERITATSAKVDQLLSVRRAPDPLFFTSTFSPAQEWEGYVRVIGTESISVDLVDISANEKKITQTAEIPLKELSDNDQGKLRTGAIFRWSIGYQRTPRGTKMRVSNIVFRDLPRWTNKDLREAEERAAKLREYFKPGRPELPSETDFAQR